MSQKLDCLVCHVFLLLSKLDLRRLMLGVKHSPQQGLGAQRNLREILGKNFQSFQKRCFIRLDFNCRFWRLDCSKTAWNFAIDPWPRFAEGDRRCTSWRSTRKERGSLKQIPLTIRLSWQMNSFCSCLNVASLWSDKFAHFYYFYLCRRPTRSKLRFALVSKSLD